MSEIVPGDMLLTHGSIVLLYEVSGSASRGGYDYASLLQCACDEGSYRKLGPRVRYGMQGVRDVSVLVEHPAVRWLWRSQP